ncbi:hypothetical protein AYL99_00479 [Fonsecaea erecta]|uniref:CENP-V/GFA domain-containing protein n=1 Tax=Fonsecaea erecta TaxID=1367422 RepID=A0A178ZXT3_9EURO|nr:hypothetical protein AYL99_00479 [Fonsecaea erecta]OAP64507.1 hypothetical protein AYL99_00479 [Fonsecaea erecta]
MEGRCQCGQCRFTTPSPRPLELYICHCTECRHQSSSAYGVTAIFRYFDFKQSTTERGAIAMYARPNSDGFTEGYFCTACGSRLAHVSVSPEGKVRHHVSIKGGCLEGLSKEMMRFAVHIWTRSAIVDIPEGAVQYEEEPPEDLSWPPEWMDE